MKILINNIIFKFYIIFVVDSDLFSLFGLLRSSHSRKSFRKSQIIRFQTGSHVVLAFLKIMVNPLIIPFILLSLRTNVLAKTKMESPIIDHQK